MPTSDDADDSAYWRNASDSLLNAINAVKSTIDHANRGLLAWSNRHPIWSKIVGVPLTTLGGVVFLYLVGVLISFFYGRTVPISDDIMLGTLPLPVGLSIYLLVSLWLFTAYLAYIHIATHRQRIEALEDTIAES